MTRQSEETAVAIARLTQEGFECKDQDPDEAISKFLSAYQKSRLINDDVTERTCAFNLGAAYVGQNKAKEGLKYLHKATPPENEDNDRSNGDLYYNMGYAFEQTDDDDASANALKYYEKAQDEFRIKGGNQALEMHCLQKCLSLQQKLKRFIDAAKCFKQMAAINSAKRNYLGQADCLCEMALQYQKAKRDEDASAAACESFNVLTDFTAEGKECFAAARVLNELGLLYTQIQSYQEALGCFERALENVNQADGEEPQLQVVIMQNLGAAYNFLCDFQRARKFHEDAIEHYSKLNYRNGQGQCYTNLAFALSHLNKPELKDAEVAFHHALRAAIDTGDNTMKWQVLEGLGAVNYQQGNYEGAIKYFQDALQSVGQNKAASKRIKEKLRHVTELNCNKGRGGMTLPYTGRTEMMGTLERTPRLGSIREGTIQPQEVSMMTETPMMSRAEVEPDSVVTVQQQRRIIAIRKKDSFGPHFPKVARGLATMSTAGSTRGPTARGLQLEEDEEESSEESSSEDSTSESDSSSTEDEAGTVRETVREPAEDPQTKAYQQALEAKEASEAKSEAETETSSDEDDTGSSSTENESEEEEDTENQTKVAVPPPVPTQSPPQTSVLNTQDLATYQTSQSRQNNAHGSSDRHRQEAGDMHQATTQATIEHEDENPYAEIDQLSRSQQQATAEGNNITNEQFKKSHAPNDNANRRNRPRSANFFDSEEESSRTEHKSPTSESKASSSTGDSEESDEEETARKVPTGQRESRGQQEVRLFQEHQRISQESATQGGPPLPPRGDEKRSKTCIVM